MGVALINSLRFYESRPAMPFRVSSKPEVHDCHRMAALASKDIIGNIKLHNFKRLAVILPNDRRRMERMVSRFAAILCIVCGWVNIYIYIYIHSIH